MMDGQIAKVWAEPDKDAPAIQIQAHRLMMQLLMRIRKRVPTIFVEPQAATGRRIMDAALAAALKVKLDPALRNAALDLLQRRVKTFDPKTPSRLFLAKPKLTNPLARDFGDKLECRESFQKALYLYINHIRPGKSLALGASAPGHDNNNLPPLQACGLLLALLVLRQGQCNVFLLGRILESLAEERPKVGGRWAWVDVTLPESVSGAAQLRRIHLDPVCLTAWCIAAQVADAIPKPAKDLKAAKIRQHYTRLAGQCFKAILQAIECKHPTAKGLTLRGLCDAQAQWLRLESMPLIATYASGGIASSSLHEDTWLRLIGRKAQPLTSEQAAEEQGPEATTTSPAMPGITWVPEVTDKNPEIVEQLTSGDLEENGLLAEIRSIMKDRKETWHKPLEQLAERLFLEKKGSTTAYLAVKWLDYMAFDRSSKSRFLSAGTLRHLRGLIINRLITVLPSRLEGTDADELSELYREVIDTAASKQQVGRVLGALREFDRYVRAHHLHDLPIATLVGFEGGSYAISSRIIVDAEYEIGCNKIKDGALVFPDERLKQQTHAFWILAFRLGLRRGEILGLRACDLSDVWIRIRPNPIRGLKTMNAERVIPANVLTIEEKSELLSLCQDCKPKAYVFFPDEVPNAAQFEAHPVIGKINKLLLDVTGNDHLHPHNLRHSCATLTLLGMLGQDVGLDKHRYAEMWMRTCINAAERVQNEISGKLHYYAGRGSALAVMMGHGIETTTYEHYVHCLDLLLFFATNRYEFDEEKIGNIEQPARFKRSEVQLLTAMMGYAETTRLETQDMLTILKRLSKYVTVLDDKTESTISSGAAPCTFENLCKDDDVKSWRGWPVTQAQRDTAIETLKLLNKGLLIDKGLLLQQLGLWAKRQLKQDDWSSMTPKDAVQWINKIQPLPLAQHVEALQVWMPVGTRRNQKIKLLPADVVESLPGRIWIRLADPRREPPAKRQRTQPAVTWTLLAFLNAQKKSV